MPYEPIDSRTPLTSSSLTVRDTSFSGRELLRLDHREHAREVRGLHAERADDLDLLETITSIGSATMPFSACVVRPICRWRPRLRRHMIELRHVVAMPSASTETWAPPPVSGMMAPVGVVLRGVHGGLGAELLRERELVVGDVDGDHARAEGGGDLDGGEPDAAAAVHGHPLARPHLRLIDEPWNDVMKRQPMLAASTKPTLSGKRTRFTSAKGTASSGRTRRRTRARA